MNTPASLTIAVIQTFGNQSYDLNLEAIHRQVVSAAEIGAKLVVLPEMAFHRAYNRHQLVSQAETIPGPTTEQLSEWAQSLNLWIIGGSIPEKIPNSTKIYNSCPIIEPSGNLATVYRKIHLFDSQVPEAATSESNIFEAGSDPCLIDIEGIRIGVAICFDLRFPDLFRSYSKQGAELLAIPSNFTAKTGEAHWEVLLRARAIENLAYVVAPNQIGNGGNQIESYGNSMVIDPWGRIIDKLPSDQPGIIICQIESNHVRQYRRLLPVLS